MKKNFKLLFICALSCYFVACSSDSDVINYGDTDSSSTQLENQESNDYDGFIEKLKAENSNIIFYNDDNRPDFSKEIEEIRSKLEIADNNIVASRQNSTKASGSITLQGPYGNPKLGTMYYSPVFNITSASWTKISSVQISHDSKINGLKTYWTDERGNYSASPYIGGYGDNTDWLVIDPYSEYITDIYITHCLSYIRSITFTVYNQYTNLVKVYTYGKPKSGSNYGKNIGNYSSKYQIQGICASGNNYIHSVGGYVYPANNGESCISCPW